MKTTLGPRRACGASIPCILAGHRQHGIGRRNLERDGRGPTGSGHFDQDKPPTAFAGAEQSAGVRPDRLVDVERAAAPRKPPGRAVCTPSRAGYLERSAHSTLLSSASSRRAVRCPLVMPVLPAIAAGGKATPSDALARDRAGSASELVRMPTFSA